MKKKKSKFHIFMLIYILVFMVAIAVVWYKLWDIVSVYEDELPEHAIERFVEDFDDTNYIPNLCTNNNITVSEFEDSDKVLDKYLDINIDKNTITYKRTAGKYTTKNPTYTVMSGKQNLMEVKYKKNSGKKGKNKWSVDTITYPEIKIEGGKTVKIVAPEDYSVEINGVQVKSDYISKSTSEGELIENVKAYVTSMPNVCEYTIENIYSDYEVKAYNQEGDEMEGNVEGDNYTFGFQATEEFANENTSWIIDMINKYALYISNDGSFSALTPYLHPDDTVYGLKSKLSTIGVTWYTDHNSTSLKDQAVSEFKMYNDECFSCVVTFKQMVYGVGFKQGNDVENDNRLICIFVKNNGEWKWAGMNTLEIDK